MDKNSEVRTQNAERNAPATAIIRFVLNSAFCVLTFSSGCTYESSSSPPMTMKQKQEATLRDPIQYKPDNENTNPYDLSGGGINNLDKDALKRDLHHVLDP